MTIKQAEATIRKLPQFKQLEVGVGSAKFNDHHQQPCWRASVYMLPDGIGVRQLVWVGWFRTRKAALCALIAAAKEWKP